MTRREYGYAVGVSVMGVAGLGVFVAPFIGSWSLLLGATVLGGIGGLVALIVGGLNLGGGTSAP